MDPPKGRAHQGNSGFRQNAGGWSEMARRADRVGVLPHAPLPYLPRAGAGVTLVILVGGAEATGVVVVLGAAVVLVF